MIQSLLKILGGGVFVIFLIRIFFNFFGGYVGALFYHINVGIYLFSGQSFLSGSTILFIIYFLFFIIIVEIFKKVKGAFDF